MVLIFGGSSEKGAHVGAISVFDLFKASRIVSSHKSDFKNPKRPLFRHTCATYFELLFNLKP